MRCLHAGCHRAAVSLSIVQHLVSLLISQPGTVSLCTCTTQPLVKSLWETTKLLGLSPGRLPPPQFPAPQISVSLVVASSNLCLLSSGTQCSAWVLLPCANSGKCSRQEARANMGSPGRLSSSQRLLFSIACCLMSENSCHSI